MACVVDLSQNATRARIGSAHCRSSLFYSMSRQNLFTPNELAAMQGWPTKDLTPEKYAKVFKCFEAGRVKLSFKDHTELLGNGMHLGAVAAVYLFTASRLFLSIVPRGE